MYQHDVIALRPKIREAVQQSEHDSIEAKPRNWVAQPKRRRETDPSPRRSVRDNALAHRSLIDDRTVTFWRDTITESSWIFATKARTAADDADQLHVQNDFRAWQPGVVV
jgi:hypothetical protein